VQPLFCHGFRAMTVFMETLSKHFRVLTKVAMERHGFAQADILSHWSDIAGEKLGNLCTPEKVKWHKADGAPKGVLTVRASAGRSLDVQYGAPALMERINQFLGYQAITSVKVVVDTAVAPALKRPEVPDPLVENVSLPAMLDTIPDPALKASLSRLALSLRRSPQLQD
jgi:hypothetical protein